MCWSTFLNVVCPENSALLHKTIWPSVRRTINSKKKKKKRLMRCSIIYMFITANLKHLELKHVRRWCDDKNEWLCVTLSSAKFHTYDNFPKNTIVTRHCSVLQHLTSDITCLFFLRCYVLASRSGITTTCTVHDCTNTTAGGVSKDRASVLCKKKWIFRFFHIR